MNPAWFRIPLPALLVMSIYTDPVAFLLWRNTRDFRSNEEVRLQNSFQLGMAFGLSAAAGPHVRDRKHFIGSYHSGLDNVVI
nr:hypothetical protein [Candidatus Methylobacter favarea]